MYKYIYQVSYDQQEDSIYHRLGNFRGAIFDGLLRRLQNSSLSDSRRTSVGKFLWSNLRWTSSPTSKFFFERFSTHIGWEIFVERSSMDFFANFKILLWAILDAHRLGKFLGAIFDGLLRQLQNSSSDNSWCTSVGKVSWSDPRAIRREVLQELTFLYHWLIWRVRSAVWTGIIHKHHRRPRLPLVHAPSQVGSRRQNKTWHKKTIPTGRIQI